VPISISRPSWSMIEGLVKGSRSHLIICAPWVSAEGVRKLSAYLAANLGLPCLEIWTRLADVLTDSRGILDLARAQAGRGTQVVLRDSPDLHAKIYYSDDSAAVFGSANLTDKAIGNGLEIVASCSEKGELSQIKAVLESIRPATQTVSPEELEYFNTSQRPELEEAESDADRPNVMPVWRRTAITAATANSEGRRAFLVGAGPKSEKVHLIVKMALWRGRSINRYDLIDGTRLEKIGPAKDADIDNFKSRGYEVKEPYYAEGETDHWVKYGIEQAQKLGLKIEK